MIPLGFEIGSGVPVEIPVGHTIFLGATQRAGKTTALESAAVRSGSRCLAFLTKRGEQSFRTGRIIPAYYSEECFDWRNIRAIVEALTEDRFTQFQRQALRMLCEDGELGTKQRVQWMRPTTLHELKQNLALAYEKASGSLKMTLAELRADLASATRELDRLQYESEPPELEKGLNVVDLEHEERHIQSLIITDMMHWVRRREANTIIALPEMWKFAPGVRRTPVGDAAKEFIRESAALSNFLWLDSQTLSGLSEEILSQVRIWLFGVQRTAKQIEKTLDLIPDNLDPRPRAADIQTLRLGEFLVAFDNEMYRTYVQPVGVNSLTAEAIARGEEQVETAQEVMRQFDRTHGVRS